jgi:hypothetical protein
MKVFSDTHGWPCHKSIDKMCDHKTCPDTDCQFKEFLQNGLPDKCVDCPIADTNRCKCGCPYDDSVDLHTKLPTKVVDLEK